MGIVLAAIAAPALLVLTVFLVAVCCFRSGSGKSRSAVGTVDEQSPLLIADRQEAEDELASQERGQAGHKPEQQDSHPPTHASSERDSSTQRHGDGINVLTSRLDAHQVCAALWEARAKWYAIGVELQIDSVELDAIQRRNDNDSDKCITEMTDLWLRQSTVAATWENLAVALRQPTVGCGELADSIMVKQHRSDGGGSGYSSSSGGGHGVSTRVGDHGSHHAATNVPSSGRRVRVYPSAGVVTPLILFGTGGRGPPSSDDSTVKTKSDRVVNLNQDSPFDEPISPASIQGLRKPKGPKGRRLPSRRKKKEGQQPLLE